jgi:hypothetical protein
VTHLQLRHVRTFVGISEEKQLVEQYDYKPILFGGIQFLYKRSAWSMFDTHVRKKLQEKEWEVWSEYMRRKGIITRCIGYFTNVYVRIHADAIEK